MVHATGADDQYAVVLSPLAYWHPSKPNGPIAIDLALTGTWQFMSASLVGRMKMPQCLMDDLESTLYVLL